MNFLVENRYFLVRLKLANISHIYKKNDDLDKENYRPVSVICNLSKFFDRIMYNQSHASIKGFRKNHSA